MSPKPALNSGLAVPIGRHQIESAVIICDQTVKLTANKRRNVKDLNIDKDTLSKKMQNRLVKMINVIECLLTLYKVKSND